MLRHNYIQYKFRRRQALRHKKVFIPIRWIKSDFRYRLLFKHIFSPWQRQIENFPLTKIGGLYRPSLHFLDQYRKILVSESFGLKDWKPPKIIYSILFKRFYTSIYPYTKYYKSIFQSYRQPNLDLFFNVFWRTHWYYNHAYHLPRENYAVAKQIVAKSRKRVDSLPYGGGWWGFFGEVHMTYVHYKKRDLHQFLYL